MNQPLAPPDAVDLDRLSAVVEALRVGISVVDAAQRIVLVNRAYCASPDLPSHGFPSGTALVQVLRASAYRGMYGPGDPEPLLAAMAALDRRQGGRLRWRTHNGCSCDLITALLPDCGQVACAIDTTALVAARTEVETSVTLHRRARYLVRRIRRVRPRVVVGHLCRLLDGGWPAFSRNHAFPINELS